jgi:hypothetical protein
MSDAETRRAWLFGPAEGVFDGMQLELLDPHDEDDRHVLLLADHPDLAPAIRRGDKEVVVHGVTISPTLHLAMHDVVAQRILDDHPREWWETAQRLTSLGYDRHEALHMLCNVVSDEVYGHLRDEPLEEQDSIRRLAALPDAREGEPPAPSLAPNRAERRALQRRQRDKRRR